MSATPVNGGIEVPRNKGQFTQPGEIKHFPTTSIGSGSVISHDGTLAFDTLYLKSEFPLAADMFVGYLDTGKGDDAATDFRTPNAPTWSDDTNWIARLSF